MPYVKRSEEMDTRVYRYKLRVKPDQEQAMLNTLETLRHLYNRALAERLEFSSVLRLLKAKDDSAQADTLHWLTVERGEEFAARVRATTQELAALPDDERAERLAAMKEAQGLYGQKRRLLTGARHDENDPSHNYLLRVNTGCAQDCLTRLDRAFQAFFRRVKSGETPGFPRFRRFGEYRTCGYLTEGNGCKFDRAKGRVTLQHIGTLRMHYYRPLPEDSIIRTMSWTRQADGWYLNVTIQKPAEVYPHRPGLPPIALAIENPGVFYTTNDGEERAPLLPLERSLDLLAMRQQRLSRREKGSRGREEARRLVGRAHLHIAEQRKQWLIEEANRLLARYRVVVHEQVAIREAVQEEKGETRREEREINLRMMDNAWGMFFQTLRQQAPKHGATIIEIPALTEEYASRQERAKAILAAGLGSPS